MKKLRLISIFCALVMALSCFAAFPAVAADEPTWATEGGTGTQNDPYILDNDNFLTFYEATKGITAEDAYLKLATVYIKLNSDIVLNKGWKASSTAPTESTVEQGVTPSVWTASIGGTTKVRAHFDGGNHTISGIYMKTTEKYASLFGALVGSVKNLKVTNSYIENASTIGSAGVATFASRLTGGTVENCYSDAILKGNSVSDCTSGGIVGMVDWGTTNIKNCVFNGSIEACGPVGGILGKMNWSDGSLVANISNCINLGNIKSSGTYVGGIIGQENTNETVNISNCINANPNIINTATATSIGDIVGSGYSAKNTVTNTYVVNGLRTEMKFVANGTKVDKCTEWSVTEIQINDLLDAKTMKDNGFTDWTYVDGCLPVPTTTDLNVKIDDNYVIENVNVGLDFDGAAVRIEDVSGIRFATNVNVDALKALDAAGAEVKFGTYITKADFVTGEGAIEFTPEALDAAGKVCLDVYADEFFDGKQIAGTIANVNDVTVDYAGRAYVKITMDGKTETYLSDFSADDVRSVQIVAKAALSDVKAASEGKYTNALTVGEKYFVGDVETTVETENSVYSRYDSDQRKTLTGLLANATVEAKKN